MNFSAPKKFAYSSNLHFSKLIGVSKDRPTKWEVYNKSNFDIVYKRLVQFWTGLYKLRYVFENVCEIV